MLSCCTNVTHNRIGNMIDELELLEYQKCSEDPCHFIENYCQIISLDEGLVPFKLRGYQESLIEHFNSNRFSVVLAARQSGKSITS